MNLKEFIDLINHLRLGFDLSKVSKDGITVSSKEDLTKPDSSDPLKRTFFVFAAYAYRRLGVSVQPRLYGDIKSIFDELREPNEIFSNVDRIKDSISKGLAIDVFKIQHRCNLGYVLDHEVSAKQGAPPVRKLTEEDLNEVLKKGPFALTEESIRKGFAFGCDDDVGQLAVFCYSYATIHDVGEVLNIATRPDQQQKGYASACLVECANAILKADRIPLYGCREENRASAKTAERVGFTLITKTLRFWQNKE
jgi:ribosomal protein S18 acetylase RimI-like enzyme